MKRYPITCFVLVLMVGAKRRAMVVRELPSSSVKMASTQSLGLFHGVMVVLSQMHPACILASALPWNGSKRWFVTSGTWRRTFCSDSSTTSPTSQPSAAADLTQPSTDTTKDLATSAPTTMFDGSNTTDSNSADCAELQVQLRTDRWPSENSLTITEVGVLASIVRNSTGPVDSLILLDITASDLESSTEYQWDLCIYSDSNQTCTVLNFTDIIEDGLADTDNLLVALDGEVVYDE
mmetsp:Transcript_104297/g.292198  ORF Transcript_104297/g.292198 Transcript_104297/m.292198 type:complete len:236 (+) Transcript_104297:1097-1804(+)